MVSKIFLNVHPKSWGKMLQFDDSRICFQMGWNSTTTNSLNMSDIFFPHRKCCIPRVTKRILPSYVNPWRWNAKHGRPTWEWPMWEGGSIWVAATVDGSEIRRKRTSWYGKHLVFYDGLYTSQVVVWDFWTSNSRLPHWLFMIYGLMDEDFEGQRWGVKEYETCFLALELFFECQRKGDGCCFSSSIASFDTAAYAFPVLFVIFKWYMDSQG